MNTRPTTDRVRETLFNIIRDEIINADVLDLYAGTGALGIEALSRGAASAVFVEHGKKAFDVLTENITTVGVESRAHAIKWNISGNLKCLDSKKFRFSLVFMDPPYNRGLVGKTLQNLLKTDALAPGALLVIEHEITEPAPETFERLTLRDQRKYGKTLVTFFDYMI